MEIRFTLELPRDALTVPVVRRVLNSSMRTLGVMEVCLEDIEVALTEACTNVLDHATTEDEYEVAAGFNDATCVIEVLDRGHGFDADQLGRVDAEPTAEEGRGIQLIRALVDTVQFESRPEAGTIVHFEKQLRFENGSPVTALAERSGTPRVADVIAAEDEARAVEEVLGESPG